MTLNALSKWTWKAATPADHSVPKETDMQPDQDLGGRLADLDAIANSGEARTPSEIAVILAELVSLRSKARSELSGDEQGSTAKLDQLLHRYNAWYNKAVERER